MVPAWNLLRRHCETYGAYFCGGDSRFHDIYCLSPLKPNCSMADKPSSAPEDEQHGPGTAEVGEDTNSYKDWLRLGLASPSAAVASRPERMTAEIELLCGEPPLSSSSSVLPTSPTYLVTSRGISGFRAPVVGTTAIPWASYRQEMPRGPWSANLPMGATSSMIPPPVMPEFVARQFMYPISSPTPPSAPEVWPDTRVVSPPRRPQSGVWFMLRAAQNQGREPFLPQIPKSYLRIKDGRMTVRLLMKYLVTRLGLEDESEVLRTLSHCILCCFLCWIQ
ncbi:hypothetical protein MUK42_23885 [Musa troglodytarum]|uniref:Uncharacterized protein n=1 Tax=Musa troglodytarum TaxID=320322 RepID=A0A9E7KB16_9LILI|nr:hypothetical protein MUK42_23885 [Musa troglodytarum]